MKHEEPRIARCSCFMSSCFTRHLYASSIVTELILSPCLIELTTAWDAGSRTWPKTVCLPSSQSVATWVMKNWEPLVLGPALAMEREPVLCLGVPLPDSSANL